jgi:hypothetical protein
MSFVSCSYRTTPRSPPLKRILVALGRYAVEYRYPGQRATTRQMRSALRHAERVRKELRGRLGLPP